MKSLTGSINEVETIEEHIRSSEILKNSKASTRLDFEMNDKAASSKLVKAAKRMPIEIEENSTSTNLTFSAGAWYSVVQPSIVYWNNVNEEKTCKIGDYIIKVGGIETRKEMKDKHVNTKIVFLADRDKIVCHLYNTTQLILINGRGYQKFIDLFLKPFFTTKIDECIEEIEQMNNEIVKKLGARMVKRSDIKLKKGPAFPCNECGYTSKSVAHLKKHKVLEHIGFNSPKKVIQPRQSTRNNSMVEHLMIEDVTIENLTVEDDKVLDESCSKFTCEECGFVTKSKDNLAQHVISDHTHKKNEEIKFVCTFCAHEFQDSEEYDNHIMEHIEPKDTEKDFLEVENKVFLIILEHLQTEDRNDTRLKCICKKCEQVSKISNQNTEHIDESTVNEELNKCDLCEYESKTVEQIRNHKLDKHMEESVNQLSNINSGKKGNKSLVEQNAELIQELLNVKKTMKDIFAQLIDDFENGMKEVKDDITKHNIKTTEAVKNLEKKIDTLTAGTKPVEEATNDNNIKASEENKSVNKAKPYVKQGNARSKYQMKPRVLMVGDSVAQGANFRVIEKHTNTTIKTSKAYSSKCDNTARFKEQNVTNVVQEELKKAKFQYMVLAAPSDDITNIDVSKVNPEDSTETFKRKVETSCKNMINVAERALENNSELKEVILMNHIPRFDTKQADPLSIKPKLATYANNILQEKWLESSHKNRIQVANHELLSVPGPQQKSLYTDQRDGRYDGIHLYGEHGKQAFTSSIKNILLSSVKLSNQQDLRRPVAVSNDDMSDSFHTRCPQANFQQRQARKLYSQVVKGTPIPTQNRFSPLSKNF